MIVEHAVFTSMVRDGKAGYQVAARSPGVTAADARLLARWCPSHGALIVDESNPYSVNFHPLSDGRHALSRTCEGPGEYSGRGANQVYTHALVLTTENLAESQFQPLALLRDALAMGYLWFQPELKPMLEPITLGGCFPRRSPDYWEGHASDLGLPDLKSLAQRVADGERVEMSYKGSRLQVVECLLGLLPPAHVSHVSFATSLIPSHVRPFTLSFLVN